MNAALLQRLKTELLARGFTAAGESPNRSMSFSDDYLREMDLGELLDLMVVRREKIFWSAESVGRDIAKLNYDDVVTVIQAIKAVIDSSSQR